MGARPKLNLEPNIVERLISKVAPKAAQRLHASRVQFEVQGSMGRALGGYIGARRDRAATADWSPGGGSPAQDINPDLPMLRERSRDQMRNAPLALGALNSDCLHVVGTGLSYTPAIKARRLGISEQRAEAWSVDTKERFDAWATSPDCHLQRKHDFYTLSELAYRSWMESGDVFALTPIVDRDGADELALQLIEADRVCTPRGMRDSDTMQDGVELDGVGAPIAVHIAKYHPGDLRAGGNSWQRTEIRGADTGRRNVLHLFDPLRPNQVRGVPWIAPIVEPLRQLGKWSDSELNAAVVSSLFAIFVEMDANAFQELFDDDAAARLVKNAEKWSGEITSGKAINLLPGEKAEMKTPGRPNPAFDPFWTALVRQMGMALGVPYEVLVMHFQSSYTAARAAFVMAWRRWYFRRDRVAKWWCQPIFELWLSNEVRLGRIACPGFFADKMIRAAWCAAVWTGDGPGSVDPVKDVTAAKMRVELGISTLQQESVLHDGIDWDTKQRQRAKEVARQREDGTMPAAVPAAPPVGEAPQPTPLEQDDDSDLEDEDAQPVPPAPRK